MLVEHAPPSRLRVRLALRPSRRNNPGQPGTSTRRSGRPCNRRKTRRASTSSGPSPARAFCRRVAARTTRTRCPAMSPKPASAPARGHVVRGTGAGLRQPVLRRRQGALVLGADHQRGHHHHRHDLPVQLGRVDRGRPAEARTRSEDHQVRAHLARAWRSHRRRRDAPDALRCAGGDGRAGLGSGGEVSRTGTRPWRRSGTSPRPTA